ncbi:MAG: hypothetical protein ACRC1H_12950, partial [Caldilineaceae bacterium]
MRRFFCVVLALLAASATLLLFSAGARAQEPHRAGLLVVKGDGSTLTRCVEFAEQSVSGYDLLAASGIALSSEPAAMGVTICSLDGEGCGFPQESCFCQCQGSPCVYWSYWTLGDEGWSYANLGAGNQRVRDGDVQAWVWGAGTSGEAPEPPSATFGDICAVSDAAAAQAAGASAPLSAGLTETLPMTPTAAGPVAGAVG